MRNLISVVVAIALLSLVASCGKIGKIGKPVDNEASNMHASTKVSVYGSDSVANVDKLPDLAKTYINNYMSNKEIARVIADDDKFQVRFSTGEILEFDIDGNIKEIESPAGMPQSVVDNRILEDVRAIDPEATIVKIEIENDGDCELKLDNGKTIIYDANCKRMSVDD